MTCKSLVKGFAEFERKNQKLNNGNDIATWQEWLDEEGAHEEADADEEVERVDERSAPLWTEGKDEEDTVSSEEDSITSKLENAKNG